jgi:phenylacetate-coenzyme A ligase PaaK-like adenylate-forming protein
MNDSFVWVLRDTRKALNEGSAGIQQRQRARLAEMIAYARAHSPYYRELYKQVPELVEDPRSLPVTDKKALMARFDEWATDRDVTLDKARSFSANPDLIGERFLGRYTLATTSGTTGTPGIFITDDGSMRVTSAIFLRWIRAVVGVGDVVKFVAGGRRVAMVADVGHHSATSVAAARILRSPSRRKRVQVLSVRTPLPELVKQLNEFQPALVAPYASMAKLMATEQEAGRLQIHPVLIALAAEGLPLPEYDRIAQVFDAKVANSYAATECMFLSQFCDQKWLHVNADWAVLEAVDANYQPVPPGTPSHTVLLSNLANRVQPILRYDLGDSIVQRPDPCPCGNPLPAIRVQGRSADVVSFQNTRGEEVAIAPLAFEVDHVPGVEQFQIIQTTPTTLRVRLRRAAGADAEKVWEEVRNDIALVLSRHQLDGVTIERAEESPEQSRGGKFRTVIPLKR